MSKQKQRRPNKWDVMLLNELSKASGKNHNTIRTNVKHLTEALHIELPNQRVGHEESRNVESESSSGEF